MGGCIAHRRSQTVYSNNPNDYNPTTLEPEKPNNFFERVKNFIFTKYPEVKGANRDRINILLLGMGGVGHDGPFLTDTIIIASIKPSTGHIAMTSIPRDLEVNIPGYGKNKINNANSYGEEKQAGQGGQFAKEVIEKNFDIDIDYYIRVDFKAFSEIIDEMGGVNVSVDRAFTDTEFPAENYLYQIVSFGEGPQIMDGEKALQYARSRHGNNGEGSDFARAKRQQKVILAAKEKLLSFSTLSNPVKINGILQSLEEHLTTDITFAEILGLIQLGRGLNTNDITTFVIDNSPDGFLSQGFNSIGAYVLRPKSGNFEEINKAIKNIFEELPKAKDDTPTQIQPELTYANVEILNGTWQAGLAARTRKRLTDKEFIISSVGNTEERPIAESAIYKISTTTAPDTLQSLSEELNIPIKKEVPSGEKAVTGTDFLIILGEDFTE